MASCCVSIREHLFGFLLITLLQWESLNVLLLLTTDTPFIEEAKTFGSTNLWLWKKLKGRMCSNSPESTEQLNDC